MTNFTYILAQSLRIVQHLGHPVVSQRDSHPKPNAQDYPGRVALQMTVPGARILQEVDEQFHGLLSLALAI